MRMYRISLLFYLKKRRPGLYSIWDSFFGGFRLPRLPAPPKKGALAHACLFRRLTPGEPPGLEVGAHRLKAGRGRRSVWAEGHALRLGSRDSLRLPLADALPLRLRHIGEDLQNEVCDKRPGQIAAMGAGVQQGHI